MAADIIFVLLMAAAVFSGTRKGLIKTIWRLGAWIITGIAVYAALTPAVNFLYSTPAVKSIYDSVYNTVSSGMINTTANLPSWLAANIAAAGAQAAEATAHSFTDTAVKVIAAISLFIIIRIILGILFRVISGAAELPVINGANKLLGGICSALGMLIAVYAALALAALFINPAMYAFINDSHIVKYMFDNNILMQLFMGVYDTGKIL